MADLLDHVAEQRPERMTLAQQVVINLCGQLMALIVEDEQFGEACELLARILPEARRDVPWAVEPVLKVAAAVVEYRADRQSGAVTRRQWAIVNSDLEIAMGRFFRGRALTALDAWQKQGGKPDAT